MENRMRMIQNPEKLPQKLLSLAPTSMMMMPPLSIPRTHCLFDVNSSENLKTSLISTSLCLYNKTWPCENPKKKRKKNTRDPKVGYRPSDNRLTKEEINIARMRFLSNEERAEEERYGISTELSLLSNDPWTIKIVMTTSDLDNLSCLVLQTKPIEDHVLKYLTKHDQNRVLEGSGVTVNVYDHDTDSTHELLLRRCITLQSYALNGAWRMHFVRRRGLRKGDEIGLFWDRFASKLHFRVLSRGPL